MDAGIRGLLPNALVAESCTQVRLTSSPSSGPPRHDRGVAHGLILGEWLTRKGGVAHSSDAKAAGFSEREIARAVAAGHARRVRRSWLVSRSCDALRVAAASISGRVTCVSAAHLRGLWVPQHELPHIAVRPSASRFERTGVQLHWAPGPAPTARWTVDDPLINVLFHIARCLPQRDALAVWESALRHKLVDPAVLHLVDWRSTRARTLASRVSDLSDSGLETIFVDGMRRLGLTVRQQVWIDGHPVDALIGDRLVIQLDGFAHHQARDRRRDLRADARLVLRGFCVLRFDFQQVLYDWEHVEATVMEAVAQGRHRIGRDEIR